MSSLNSLSPIVIVAVWFAMGTSVSKANSSKFFRYDGKHIRLQTDVGTKQDAKDYVTTFDAATQQWAAYWKLPAETIANWSVDAVIMSDRNAATAAGLMKPRVPDFKFGYAAGNTLYVIAQPSAYYTEHLLMHEGVHALAQHAFGGRGPTWFMEGSAELLATHRGRGSNVEINRIPLSRQESPYWGRLKVIRERRESGTIPSVESIMRTPPTLDGDLTAYSWSWAISMLLTQYPEYNETFTAMTVAGHDSSNDLTRQLYQRLMSDWPALVARFRLMSHSLDYGFDWDQERVQLSSRDPIWQGEPSEFTITADHGWQSAGVVIPAGNRLAVNASGDAVLALDPKPWRSEPDGVTIRYHDGLPLGKLIACLVPVQYSPGESLPSLETIAIGSQASVLVSEPSWIAFRVNDSVGELSDNSGSYQIRVRVESTP